MQTFEWKYHDEKVLFKKHESKASAFFRALPKILAIIIVGSLVSTIIYYISKSFLYTGITASVFLIILFVFLFFIIKFYKETFFAFTDKRAVKSVRNWLFAHHLKELKIDNIKQTTSNNSGMFGKIFGYWNIIIQWPEEKTSLYFRNISENKAIVLYISRMIDYMKKDWDSAELWEFKSNFSKK